MRAGSVARRVLPTGPERERPIYEAVEDLDEDILGWLTEASLAAPGPPRGA